MFGLQQFVIGKPIWETYLKGEEPDPKMAHARRDGRGPGRGQEAK